MTTKNLEVLKNSEIIHSPHNFRLPGFITDKEIGLGDAIKKVSYSMGIKPCGGCEQRAAILNNWAVFNKGNK